MTSASTREKIGSEESAFSLSVQLLSFNVAVSVMHASLCIPMQITDASRQVLSFTVLYTHTHTHTNGILKRFVYTCFSYFLPLDVLRTTKGFFFNSKAWQSH